MRKADIYLVFTAALILLFIALLFVHPLFQSDHEDKMTESRRLVRELKLTDLCLFTEARYTRNITQADLHTPFQDHPFSFEHFPSGSMVAPPEHLTRDNEKR
jgi:hypothetical protein